MSSRANPKVVVLMGGPSREREVSLSSGRECATALRSEGFDVHEVDAGQDVAQKLRDLAPDVVFNALHGRWGEDGCVQGILEWLHIPYTHSGVLASALAMDKQRSKEVYRRNGLPIVDSILAPKGDVCARHMDGATLWLNQMPKDRRLGCTWSWTARIRRRSWMMRCLTLSWSKPLQRDAS